MSDYLASPLRYPGGKSKVAKMLLPFIPPHDEYREPFVGGGGIFFAKPKAKVNWINDSHPGLYAFYKTLRDVPNGFCSSVERAASCDPEKLFKDQISHRDLMEIRDESLTLERALQFYIINRLVWGGRVCYDPRLKSRLFFSNPTGLDNIEKKLAHLKQCSEKLQGVEITNFHALSPELPKAFLNKPHPNVFIYIDPPYYRDSKDTPTSKLYEGDFSLSDHECLTGWADLSPHKLMFSYDDCPEVRSWFAGPHWRIVPLSWTYCGRSARTKADLASGTKEIKPRGKELLIMNYEIPEAARSLVPA